MDLQSLKQAIKLNGCSIIQWLNYTNNLAPPSRILNLYNLSLPLLHPRGDFFAQQNSGVFQYSEKQICQAINPLIVSRKPI